MRRGFRVLPQRPLLRVASHALPCPSAGQSVICAPGRTRRPSSPAPLNAHERGRRSAPAARPFNRAHRTLLTHPTPPHTPTRPLHPDIRVHTPSFRAPACDARRKEHTHYPPAKHSRTMEATVVCVDNSEWTRNGDYAPTRFQVRRGMCRVYACTCVLCRAWARLALPALGERASPFDERRAVPLARTPLTFSPPLSPIPLSGPGRRGQPAGRRQDAGKPGKRGGRADHGGESPPRPGHAHARPRASVERDAGERNAGESYGAWPPRVAARGRGKM